MGDMKEGKSPCDRTLAFFEINQIAQMTLFRSSYGPDGAEVRLNADVRDAIVHAHVPSVGGTAGESSRRQVVDGLHVGKWVTL